MANISKIKLPDGVTYNIQSSTLKNLVDGSQTGSVRGINTAAEDANYTIGTNATVLGTQTKASGNFSFAEGNETIANHLAQHVFGEYNIADASTAAAGERGNYVEIVGNGAYNARSNARTLDWSGNEVLAGKLTVGVAGTNSLDVATVGQIPTVPTNVSAFTNDAGYLTSYTDTNTWRNIKVNDTEVLSTSINSGAVNFKQGTGINIVNSSGTLEISTTVVNTDSKLALSQAASGTMLYPIIGSGTTAAERCFDTTGFTYINVNGTTSSIGSSVLTLGNSTASGTAGNKQAVLRMYGSNAKYATITLDAPSADITLNLPVSSGTLALTSQLPSVPATTGSATTGISVAAHSTDSIYGVSSSTTSVYGVSSSTTTASKVTVGSSSTDYGVTAAGSGSASLTFTMDTTDTKKLKITFSHTHTAPTLGSKVPTVSANDVTVPIKNADATTVPIKNSSATTVVTSATHSVTDNGHTHTI